MLAKSVYCVNLKALREQGTDLMISETRRGLARRESREVARGILRQPWRIPCKVEVGKHRHNIRTGRSMLGAIDLLFLLFFCPRPVANEALALLQSSRGPSLQDSFRAVFETDAQSLLLYLDPPAHSLPIAKAPRCARMGVDMEVR